MKRKITPPGDSTTISDALSAPKKAGKPAKAPSAAPILLRPTYFVGAAIETVLAAPKMLKAAPKALLLAPKAIMAAPRVVVHVGARGARAASLAGHAAHGGAQVMMAHTLFGLAGATDAAQGLSSRIAAKMAERSGKQGSADSPQTKLGRLIEIGMLAAVEFYPLITSIAAGSTGNHGYAPGLDPLSMPLNDLTISTALKLGGHAHREQADESFGKLAAWRAARASRSGSPAPADPSPPSPPAP